MTYHYTNSGLENIYLENGYTKHTTPYGEGISIDNTAGLHQVIGSWLISLPKPLTGAELRFLRIELDMTQRNLAALIGVEEQAVRRWEKANTKKFSGPADRFIRVLYAEYADGNGHVRSMVDRLSALDQIDWNATACFQETQDGWKVAA